MVSSTDCARTLCVDKTVHFAETYLEIWNETQKFILDCYLCVCFYYYNSSNFWQYIVCTRSTHVVVLNVKRHLTSVKFVVEQSLSWLFEQFLNVKYSNSCRPKDDDHTIPMFETVDNNVMYVPPKRGSLMRAKNDIVDTIIM